MLLEEWEQPMTVEIWRRVVSEAARKKRSV